MLCICSEFLVEIMGWVFICGIWVYWNVEKMCKVVFRFVGNILGVVIG